MNQTVIENDKATNVPMILIASNLLNKYSFIAKSQIGFFMLDRNFAFASMRICLISAF